MSFDSAIHLLKTMQHKSTVLNQAMYTHASQLASHNRLKNVAVVVNNKTHGVEVVFKPMVGATVETEKMAKSAKVLAAKLAADGKVLAREVVK